jgi:perosamine synthetase
VTSALFAAGIDTRPFFVSMHRQPALQKYGCDVAGEYPVSDALARKGLYLPSGSGLSESDLNRTIDALLSLRR